MRVQGHCAGDPVKHVDPTHLRVQASEREIYRSRTREECADLTECRISTSSCFLLKGLYHGALCYRSVGDVFLTRKSAITAYAVP
jgi:hypothetical protein